MSTTCAACGFETSDDFAFCPKCATALTASLAVPEERKVVTTLFCDLVGFTALARRRPRGRRPCPEREATQLRPRRRRVPRRRRREVHRRRRGRQSSASRLPTTTIPSARCGPPSRSLERVSAARVAGRRAPGVRIGINTGETYLHTTSVPSQAARPSSPAMPSTPLPACRAAAPPGGVVVGGPDARAH